MVCAGIVAPDPVAVKPVMPAVAVAVQVKVVPVGLAVKFTGVVCDPEQMVWLVTVLVITGATLTVKL